MGKVYFTPTIQTTRFLALLHTTAIQTRRSIVAWVAVYEGCYGVAWKLVKSGPAFTLLHGKAQATQTLL